MRLIQRKFVLAGGRERSAVGAFGGAAFGRLRFGALVAVFAVAGAAGFMFAAGELGALSQSLAPAGAQAQTQLTAEFLPEGQMGATPSIREGETAALRITVPTAQTEAITVNVALTGDIGALEPIAADAGASAVSATYDFEAEPGAFRPLGADALTRELVAGDADDGAYGALALGFDFQFYGATYSQIYAGTNGLLTFEEDPDLFARLTNASGQIGGPALFPLWDDLDNASGAVRTATLGAPGERVFVYEAIGAEWDYDADAATIDYQARLYEATGAVEFIYDHASDGADGLSAPSATIGVAKSGGEHLTLSDATANPTASGGEFTTDIDARPARGQIYRFTPASVELELALAPGSVTAAAELKLRSGAFAADGGGAVNASLSSPTDGVTFAMGSDSLDLTLAAGEKLTASLSVGDAIINPDGTTATLTVAAPSALSEAVSAVVRLTGDYGRLLGSGSNVSLDYDFEVELRDANAFELLPDSVPQLAAAVSKIYETVAIGFPFDLYGEAHTRIRPTTQDILSFDLDIAAGDLPAANSGTIQDLTGMPPFQLYVQPALYAAVATFFNAANVHDSSTEIRATTLGAPGERVFVYEARNVGFGGSTEANRINYQVRLYEGANRIEYIYDPLAANGQTSTFEWDAAIARDSTDGNFAVLSGASVLSPTVNTQASFGSITNGIQGDTSNGPLRDGLVYSFTPRAELAFSLDSSNASRDLNLAAQSGLADGAAFDINFELISQTPGYAPAPDGRYFDARIAADAAAHDVDLAVGFDPVSSIAEGGSTELVVRRLSDARADAPVTVQVARAYFDADGSALTTPSIALTQSFPLTITLGAGESEARRTLTANNNSSADGDITAELRLSTTTAGFAFANGGETVALTLRDNDGVSADFSAATIDDESGATVLRVQTDFDAPAGGITVNATFPAGVTGSGLRFADDNSEVTTNPIALTIPQGGRVATRAFVAGKTPDDAPSDPLALGVSLSVATAGVTLPTAQQTLTLTLTDADRAATTVLTADLSTDIITARQQSRLTVRAPSTATERIVVRVILTGDVDDLSAVAGSQTGADYRFEAAAGSYAPLTGTALTRTHGDSRGGVYGPLNIGFAFDFYGQTYTQARANTHGALTFKAAADLSDADFADYRANGDAAQRAGAAPALFPLWDRQQFADAGETDGEATAVRHSTSGSAPNRVWTFEARGVYWSSVKTGQPTERVIDYQVRLHEGTGVIEYVYNVGSGYDDPHNPSADIGIAQSGTEYLRLSDAGVSPAVDIDDWDAAGAGAIGARPASGQVYRFIPATTVDAAIGVGATEATLDLVAPSDLNEIGAVQADLRSRTDGYAVAGADSALTLRLTPPINLTVGFGADSVLEGETTALSVSGAAISEEVPVAVTLTGDIAKFAAIDGARMTGADTVEIDLPLPAGATRDSVELTALYGVLAAGETAALAASFSSTTPGVVFLPANTARLTLEAGVKLTPELSALTVQPGQTTRLTVSAPSAPSESVRAIVRLSGDYGSLTGVGSDFQLKYDFEAAIETRAYQQLPDSVAKLAAASDKIYETVAIGFPFDLYGDFHTRVRPTTNGILSFDLGVTSDDLAKFSTRGTLTDTTAFPDIRLFVQPALYPLFTTVLSFQENVHDSNTEIRATTLGAEGERVFVYEARNVGFGGSTAANRINYQVRLYEGTNRIEYIYDPLATSGVTSTNQWDAGIAKGGVGGFLFLSGADARAPEAVTEDFSGTIASGIQPAGGEIVSTPRDGLVYRFTPSVDLEVNLGPTKASAAFDLVALTDIEEGAAFDVGFELISLTPGYAPPPDGRTFSARVERAFELTPRLSATEIVEGEAATVLSLERPASGDISEALTAEVVLRGALGDLVGYGGNETTVRLTFLANETASATLTLEAGDDAAVESDKTVEISFGRLNGYIFIPPRLSLTIKDDDVLLTASGSSATVEEGGQFVYTLTRDSGAVGLTLGTAVSVRVTLSGDGVMELAGGSAARTVTLGANERSETFALTVADDELVGSSMGSVTLSFAALTDGFAFADGSDVGFSITDGDRIALTPVLTPMDGRVTEGDAATLRVNIATAPTADAHVLDVVVVSGGQWLDATSPIEVEIKNGDMFADVTLNTLEDTVVNGERTVELRFDSADPATYAVSPGGVTLTIVDDDEYALTAGLALAGASGVGSGLLTAYEGETVVLTVASDAAAIEDIDLTVTLTPASVSAGDDINAIVGGTPTAGASFNLTIAQGRSQAALEFALTLDDAREAAETVAFALAVSADDPAALADSDLTLIIRDLALTADFSRTSAAPGQETTLTVRAPRDAPAGGIAVRVALTGHLLGLEALNGSSDGGYLFEAASGGWSPLETGTTASSSGSGNDTVYGPLTIPFGFNFYGETYTAIRASSRGFLSFNPTATLTGRQNNNLQTNRRDIAPALVPLWDRIGFPADGTDPTEVRVATLGNAPNRVWVFEVIGARWRDSQAERAVDYQVRLREGSNAIEYVYNAGDGYSDPGGGNITATIAIVESQDEFVSLSDASAAPTASGTITNNIGARPANGQIYRFSPATAVELTIAEGQRSASLVLTARDGELFGGNESAAVNAHLSSPTPGYAPAPGSDRLTLRLTATPQEPPPDPITLTVDLTPTSMSIEEGEQATLTVSRPSGTDADGDALPQVIVTASPANPTGVSLSGTTLTIPANQTMSDAITITADDDDFVGADSSVALTLTAGTALYNFAPGATETVVTLALTDSDAIVTAGYSTLRLNEGADLTVRVGRADADKDKGAVTITVAATGGDTAGLTAATRSQTLTIADGDTSGEVTLTALNDHAPGTASTVNLTLTLASGQGFAFDGTALETTAVLTLLDDDLQLTAAFVNDRVDEGGSARLNITAVNANGVATPVSQVVQGSVMLSGDTAGLTSTSADIQIFTINAGASSTFITLATRNDDSPGGDSMVTVTLSERLDGVTFEPTQAFVNANDESELTATLTLTDDDVRLRAEFAPPSISEGETATLTITRSGGAVQRTLGETVTVTVTTVTGDVGLLTAASPGAGAIVVIPAGETAASVDFGAIDDDAASSVGRSVTIGLRASQDGFAFATNNRSVTLTLTDNDFELTAELNPTSIDEGETATLTVSRDLDAQGNGPAVTLALTLAGDASGRLVSPPTSVTIPENTASATVDFAALNDAIVGNGAGSVTVTVDASAADGASFANGEQTDDFTLTLTDDDVALTASLAPTSIDEDEAATLTVSRTLAGGVGPEVTLALTLAGDSGRLVSPPTSVTIPANTMSATVDFTAMDDAIVGSGAGSVTITVDASGADGFAFAGGSQTDDLTLTLTDSDALLTASLSPPSIDEGETATLTVSRALDNGVGPAVTLSIRQPSGDASGRLVSPPTSITIPANTASASVSFTAMDDAMVGSGAGSVTITVDATGEADFAFANGDQTDDLTLTLTDSDRALTVDLSPNTIDEGEAATLTVSRELDNGVGPAVTLAITLSGDDGRLVSPPSGLTIAENTASASVDFAALNDNAVGSGDGSVTITLDASGEANFAFASGEQMDAQTLTLTDDDVNLTAALDENSIFEGASAILTVSRALDNGVGPEVTIQVALAITGGIALDKTGTQTVTIAANAAEGMLTLTAVDNATRGDDATVELSVSSQTDGFAFNGSETVTRSLTLQDNDALSGVFTRATAGEGEQTVLRITTAGNAPAPAGGITVTVTFPAGASSLFMSGLDDLNAQNQITLTIAEGAMEVERTLTVANDDTPSADETLDVTLTATGASFEPDPLTRTLTLTDDDVLLTANLSADSIGEGQAATLTVSRPAGSSTGEVVVTVTPVPASNSDTDGVTLSSPRTLTIPAGQLTSNALTITAVNDDKPGETTAVSFTLNPTTSGHGFSSVGVQTAEILTLTDDDVALEALFVGAGGAAIDELDEGQAATLTVRRVVDANGAWARTFGEGVTVSVALTGDFNLAERLILPSAATVDASGRRATFDIVIDPNETGASVALTALDDDAAPGDVTLTATLSESEDQFAFAPPTADADGVATVERSLTLLDDEARLDAVFTTLAIGEGRSSELTIERGSSSRLGETATVDVVIAVEPGGIVLTAPTTLTHTLIIPANQMRSDPLTLTAEDNMERRDSVDVTVTLTTRTSGFAFLSGESVAPRLRLLDNDSLEGGFVNADGELVAGGAIAENGLATLEIRTPETPTVDIPVEVSFPDGAAGVLRFADGPNSGQLATTFTLTVAAGTNKATRLFRSGKARDNFPNAPLPLSVDLVSQLDAAQFSANPLELTLTLTDSDVLLTADLTPDSVDEGEAATLTVRRSRGTDADGNDLPRATVSVRREGADRFGATLSGGTLTIEPGETMSNEITVTAVGDDLVGADSTIDLRLRALTSGHGFSSTSLEAVERLTLTDDDVRLEASFGVAALDEGGSTTLTVRRAGGAVQRTLGEAVTVSVTLTGDAGNLSAPSATTFDILIDSNQMEGTATFTAVDDDRAGGALSVTATLTESADGFAFAGGAARAAQDLTLNDNDVRLTARFTANPIAEGGSTQLTVERATASSAAVTVAVTLASARAAFVGAGDDIIGLVGTPSALTLTIAAGQTASAPMTLTAVDNDVRRDTTDVTLTFTSQTTGFAFVGGPTATETLRLLDNDSLDADFSRTSIGEGEETTLRVRALGGAPERVRVRVTLPAGAALFDLNANAPAARELTLTIEQGQTEVTRRFRSVDDELIGAVETLQIELRSLTDAVPFASAPFALPLTLTDDDLITLTPTLDADSIGEGDAARLTITASEPVLEAVTVSVAISEAPVSDPPGLLGAATRELTIPRGGRSASVVLTAFDDDEQNEDSLATLTFAVVGQPESVSKSIDGASLRLELTDMEREPPALRGVTSVFLPSSLSVISGTSQPIILNYEQGSGAADLRTTVRWRLIGGDGVASVEERRLGFDFAKGQPEFSALVSFSGVGSATLQAILTQVGGGRLIVETRAVVLNVSAPTPRSASDPPPAPVNPPGPPPVTILGDPVSTPETGGRFEGPSNSEVTVPPGASDDYVGVALIELPAPPAPEALPPNLGEFIPNAQVLDVTFRTQRGIEVGRLENAATVCLPVNGFILSAVDGDARRLQVVRYHLGVWTGLESAYDAAAGLICARSQLFSAFALTALPVELTTAPTPDGGAGALSGALPQTGGGLFVAPLWLALVLALTSAAALAVGAALIRRFARRS